MTRLIDAITRRATGRHVAWSWAGFFAFALIAFPLFDAVNGMPAEVTPLDLQFGYRPDAVAATLGALGDGGRMAYLRTLLIADLVWPLVYGSTLALSIAWGLQETKWQRRLIWLPMAAVVLDYGENLLISLHIALWPSTRQGLAVMASGFSGAKWLAAGGATVVGSAALLRAAKRGQAARRAGVSSS